MQLWEPLTQEKVLCEFHSRSRCSIDWEREGKCGEIGASADDAALYRSRIESSQSFHTLDLQRDAVEIVGDSITTTSEHDMTQSERRIVVGVLALQGAFSEHIQLLRKAFGTVANGVTWSAFEVRTAEQLAQCDALIIPGGESTAIALVAARSGLLEPLRSFVKYESCRLCLS